MFRHFPRVIALTLALGAAVAPAAQAAHRTDRLSTSPCSEVCSGGAASYALPASLSSTGPCSEVCSSGATSYGSRELHATTTHSTASGRGPDWGPIALGFAGLVVLIGFVLFGVRARTNVGRRTRRATQPTS